MGRKVPASSRRNSRPPSFAEYVEKFVQPASGKERWCTKSAVLAKRAVLIQMRDRWRKPCAKNRVPGYGVAAVPAMYPAERWTTSRPSGEVNVPE